MKIYSKYLIVLIAIISFSSFIPYFYSIIFAKSHNKDVVSYSEIIDDFVIRTFTANREILYTDKAGNSYSYTEFKALLPQVYTKDLLLTNEYSEIINGKIISAEDMVLKNFYFSVRPKIISDDKIRIRLMPIFNTLDTSANLEIPLELARIGKDITFINARTRKINHEKSELFTNKLKQEGFLFPVKLDGSNPDARKPFDAGLFLIDSKNELYRLYMVKGEPMVEKYKDSIKDYNISLIAINENKYADYYGYMISDNGSVLFINNNKTISKLVVDGYNTLKDEIRININPLHILVTLIRADSQQVMLYNKNNEFIKSYQVNIESNMNPYAEKVFNIIFPYYLYNDSNTAEDYLKIEFSKTLLLAFIFSLFLALIYFFMCYKWQNLSKVNIIDILIIICSGIYGFIALLLLQNFKRDRLWE